MKHKRLATVNKLFIPADRDVGSQEVQNLDKK